MDFIEEVRARLDFHEPPGSIRGCVLQQSLSLFVGQIAQLERIVASRPYEFFYERSLQLAEWFKTVAHITSLPRRQRRPVPQSRPSASCFSAELPIGGVTASGKDLIKAWIAAWQGKRRSVALVYAWAVRSDLNPAEPQEQRILNGVASPIGPTADVP